MAQCVDVIRVTNAVARQGREYRRNSEGELARIVLLTRLTEMCEFEPGYQAL